MATAFIEPSPRVRVHRLVGLTHQSRDGTKPRERGEVRMGSCNTFLLDEGRP